jgi:hypothetical protein
VRFERAQRVEARPVEVVVDVAQDSLDDRLVIALAPRQRLERHTGDARLGPGPAREQVIGRQLRAAQKLDAALEGLVRQKLARVQRGVEVLFQLARDRRDVIRHASRLDPGQSGLDRPQPARHAAHTPGLARARSLGSVCREPLLHRALPLRLQLALRHALRGHEGVEPRLQPPHPLALRLREPAQRTRLTLDALTQTRQVDLQVLVGIGGLALRRARAHERQPQRGEAQQD